MQIEICRIVTLTTQIDITVANKMQAKCISNCCISIARRWRDIPIDFDGIGEMSLKHVCDHLMKI